MLTFCQPRATLDAAGTADPGGTPAAKAAPAPSIRRATSSRAPPSHGCRQIRGPWRAFVQAMPVDSMNRGVSVDCRWRAPAVVTGVADGTAGNYNADRVSVM